MSERIQALHALRAFEVASRYGSFTRAAEELALTQGAVSHHIKTLEACLAATCSNGVARNSA